MSWYPVHKHDHISQHLHEGGPDNHSENSARTATQATTAKHCGGNGVKFVKVAEVNGLGGVDVEYEQKTAKPRAESTNDIGENHHFVHVDTAELGRFFIVPKSQKISTVYGLVQENAC